MPTYSYQCEQCGHQCEFFQKIMDEPMRDCPSCGAEGRLQRQIGGGSALLRFQGSGFYETDYKKKSEDSSSTSSEKKKGGGCGCGKPHGGCGSS